jgi:hypothetical protein
VTCIAHAKCRNSSAASRTFGHAEQILLIEQQTGVPREAVLNDLVRAYARVRLLLGDHKLREAHRPPKS